MKSVVLAASVWFVSFTPAFAQGVNDAQIAAIVVSANQVDIDAGQLAATQASSDTVKQFAQMMVRDHSGVNKSATELVTRLKVSPQSNATSEALKAGGDNSAVEAKVRGEVLQLTKRFPIYS